MLKLQQFGKTEHMPKTHENKHCFLILGVRFLWSHLHNNFLIKLKGNNFQKKKKNRSVSRNRDFSQSVIKLLRGFGLGQKYKIIYFNFLPSVQLLALIVRERVRASKITSSKVKKRTLKVQKEHQKSEHQKFPLKGSERRKIRTTTTTYGIVPMDTEACGGLGQGQFGQVWLGLVRIGQAGLGQVTLR